MSPEEGDTTQKEKASNFQPQFLRGHLAVSWGDKFAAFFLWKPVGFPTGWWFRNLY